MSDRLGWALALAAATSCTPDPTPETLPSETLPSPVAPTVAEAPPHSPDPGRGRALVERFECARCHEGTLTEPPPAEKRCVGCHRDILAGRFEAPAEALAEWRTRLVDLLDAPPLDHASDLQTEWVVGYLLAPIDLRPHSSATMPRLALDEEDAMDLAAYLATLGRPEEERASDGSGDASRGQEAFQSERCGRCHAFSGLAADLDATPTDPTAPGRLLAPDLCFTRDRLGPATTMRRILSAHHDGISAELASDLAAFVLTAPLAPVTPKPEPARLPLLEREVTFDEVDQRVFRRTCWHCHSEPDYARGDGGPGMSGGFGFSPRRLNLSSYEGVLAGFVGDDGERRSVFSAGPTGAPVLIEAARARAEEEAGRLGARRGMPLGLPSLSPEDLALLETWVAQGHRR